MYKNVTQSGIFFPFFNRKINFYKYLGRYVFPISEVVYFGLRILYF